ncbi:heavy-metal-associated domain-containing protein [Nonlabens ponticola]|uniref:Copper chaperone n=1 Tax=Nonlabens ponticola TaxID=2496866 RepID=A0A3S9N0P3_9FLAO|nr:cation transporter [Nonlabens ponticola]AZQ44954.1 copper chaperone [Nonlabens ponticola]
MKNIQMITAFLFCFFAFTSTSSAQSAKADAQISKERDQFEVQVDGLGCPFCAYGLEKKFKEFKGIKDVKIDIETGDFSFSYPASKELTMQAVTEQVKKAGYTPQTAKIVRANGTIETNEPKATVAELGTLTTSTMMVNGKCGMCKARIEKTVADLPGVLDASWDVKTKQLVVNHDATMTNKAAISKELAAVGHDTKSNKASDATYDALPACCHYKRAI